MDIDVRQRGDMHVLRLRGDLKMGQAVDALREAIDEVIQNGGTMIVLNMTDVPVIDSSGIGILVRTLTTLKSRSSGMKLVNPSKFAIQTLKVVGLLNLFEVCADEEQAVGA